MKLSEIQLSDIVYLLLLIVVIVGAFLCEAEEDEKLDTKDFSDWLK